MAFIRKTMSHVFRLIRSISGTKKLNKTFVSKTEQVLQTNDICIERPYEILGKAITLVKTEKLRISNEI